MAGFDMFGDVFAAHWRVVVPLLASIVAALAACAVQYRRMSREDGAQFWSAAAAEDGLVGPKALLAFRAVAASCALGVWMKVVLQNYAACDEGMGGFECSIDVFCNHVFKYFTVWNWTLITAAFLVGTARSVWGTKTLARCHHAMLEVCVPLAPVVSLLTWGVLFPAALGQGMGAAYTNEDSYYMHVGNSVVCLAEFALSRPRIDRRHALFMVLFCQLYALSSVLLQLGGGESPYFFFDVAKGATLLWVVGLNPFALGVFMVFSKLSLWQAGPERPALDAKLEPVLNA